MNIFFLCLARCSICTVSETPVSYRGHNLYPTNPWLTSSIIIWRFPSIIQPNLDFASSQTKYLSQLWTQGWRLREYVGPRPGKQRPSRLCYQLSPERGIVHNAHSSNWSSIITPLRFKCRMHSCFYGLFTTSWIAQCCPAMLVSLSFVMSVWLYMLLSSPLPSLPLGSLKRIPSVQSL